MFEAVFHTAPEAMLVVDSAGVIRHANRRAHQLFAFAPGALCGRSVDTLVPAAVAGSHAGHRESYLAAPRTRPMGENLDLRGRRADGVEFAIDVALAPVVADGETFVTAIVRDITERVLGQQRLRYISEHDALTGVLNRRGFDRQLAQAVAQARRHAVSTGLLLVDLDQFKDVNDRFGHVEGDRLLCEIVRAISERLRAGDTIARLGGDELALILPFASRPAATAIGRELLGVVRSAARAVVGDEILVTASIGVAALDDAPDPVAAADAAMYDAKRGGGDAVCLATGGARDPGGRPAVTP